MVECRLGHFEEILGNGLRQASGTHVRKTLISTFFQIDFYLIKMTVLDVLGKSLAASAKKMIYSVTE